MLDLGRPALHAQGLTLFGDHADPNLFHYVPDRPALRVDADGKPELSLLKYRLDPELTATLGGGLLSLTVDLRVDPSRLEDVTGQLSRHFGLDRPPRLVPVQADAGTVELLLLDIASTGEGGTPLVSAVLGAGVPSLYGDNATTFLAVLPPQGAAVVEGALAGSGLPIGVVYALDVLGLRPALRARITARWRDVYDFFDNRLHGGKLLLAVDIGPTIEDLVEAGAMQVEIDELVPPDERSAEHQKALERIQEYVLTELFKPSLGVSAPESEAGGTVDVIRRAISDVVGAFALTFTLRTIDRTELKTLTYDLATARAERLTLSPQGTLKLAADLDRRGLVTIVEPGPSPEMRFDVGSAVDLAREGIDRLEVVMRYGEREETLALDAAAPRATFRAWYAAAHGLAVRYVFTVHFRADAEGSTASLTSDEVTTEARVIRINPQVLYRRETVRAIAQGVPFDRFPAVWIDVRAVSGELVADQTLTLQATAPEAEWSLRLPRDAAVTWQRRVRYVDTQGRETVRDWTVVEGGLWVLGDPFPGILDVQILASARFGTHVARLVVELRPTQREDLVSALVLDKDKPAATWSVRLDDPERRDYEYRVTVHGMAGEIPDTEGPWLPGSGPRLIVGEGIERIRQVQLLLAGPPLAALGLWAVRVRFEFQDPEANLFAEEEILVTDATKPLTWRYPVADAARQTWSYALTLFGATGETRLGPFSTTDLLVVHRLERI